MAIGITRLGAVRIFVTDIAQARQFYGEILDLPERIDGEDFSAFRVAGVDVVVETVSADQEALAGRFAGVSFAVADIDAALADLRAAGVTVTGAREKQVWGGIMAHIADPDGNEITLVEYPKETSA